MVEVIALVVAICAFIVSVAVPIFEFFWNRKLSRHNLQAEYFREVFGEILYQDIPMALSFIHYNGEVVTGTEKMIEVLRKIRTRSIYFKFAEPDFYVRLKTFGQDLEDYLVQSPDDMSTGEFAVFYREVNEKIEMIYKCMSDGYIGKKSK